MFVLTSPHYTERQKDTTFQIPVYVRGEEGNEGVRERERGVDR
jgi:hypothetical protein